MEPHQQRVVDESVELEDKIAKLQVFITESPIYQKLPSDEALLLSAQLAAMTAYDRILQSRILKF
ncbi:MAG: hypothetical protein RSA84_21710 [Acinetobacter sp.]